MYAKDLLQEHLGEVCPEIHSSRLQSVMDVATALQSSKNLCLAEIGRNLSSDSSVKHRIKKVDRLVGNQHLHNELADLYTGMSSYVLKYISTSDQIPLLVDLCFMKDTHDIQMLSAEIATKGRSLPLYREVFETKQLKGRSKSFLEKLAQLIPPGRDILIIMDAGFGDDWYEAVESHGWYWLARIRRKKFVRFDTTGEWQDVGELFDLAGSRAKSYSNAYVTKQQERPCRLVIKKNSSTTKRVRPKKLPRNYNSANGNYQRSSKEPWVLVTNLPDEYKTSQIVNYYKKRMQIEESFRDVKSHQYGLGARYIRTRCVHRWSVMMLLAAIVQITLWIIGVVAHSMGYQKKFQANTVKDKKVFSYFFMGQLVVQHGMIEQLHLPKINLAQIINQELERDW